MGKLLKINYLNNIQIQGGLFCLANTHSNLVEKRRFEARADSRFYVENKEGDTLSRIAL